MHMCPLYITTNELSGEYRYSLLLMLAYLISQAATAKSAEAQAKADLDADAEAGGTIAPEVNRQQ